MTSHEPIEMGRRIVVWGVSGSGKTSMARHLAECYSLPRIELDALYWNAGWVGTPDDEFRFKVETALNAAPHGWVLDGSYRRVSDLYLAAADTLIWLHVPWRVSFWRLFKRTVVRAIDQKPLYYENGPHESWRMSFLSRESVLWWSITMHRRATQLRAERIAALPPHVHVYELRSAAEVRQFLARLKAEAQFSAM
jgi:adenylate kinase family enzyme